MDTTTRVQFTQCQFFNLSLTGLNLIFSFYTKVKEPSLAYYLSIGRKRIVG